jgi:uncharacterized protein (DUF1330 family)
MPAYCLVDVHVTDPEGYKKYSSQVLPTIERFGGRFLVRGGKTEVREGAWDLKRVVLLEFPSMEKAKAWYDSPEYQAILKLRLAAADANFVFVEGWEG